MDNEFQNENIEDISLFDHYVGIQFFSTPRIYFFGTKDLTLALGDKVIVETIKGLELGVVATEPIDINKYKASIGLKPVIRAATDVDIRLSESNKRDAAHALEICKSEAGKLNLPMNLISCEFTLDKSKVLFSYLADERVDFRELLKNLASRLHTRIELRQIGSRDKAKMVGGIGVCGLPLCCATFLNEFDGISISRAKNQMLAINIPKLSGHCGKLLCCLKYEDEAYSEAKKLYPELGSKLFINKLEYTITNINVISGIIKIENREDVKFMPFEELKKQAYFVKKKVYDDDKN
jgi:cell fate regulator YaaT (PSP1 superfamily)